MSSLKEEPRLKKIVISTLNLPTIVTSLVQYRRDIIKGKSVKLLVNNYETSIMTELTILNFCYCFTEHVFLFFWGGCDTPTIS